MQNLSRQDAIGLRRFGLGFRPGDLAEAAHDPRGYHLAALAQPRAALIAGLPDGRDCLATFLIGEAAGVAIRQAAAATPPGAPVPPAPGAAPATGVAPPAAASPARAVRSIYPAEVLARARHALASETPFLERLVMFWSNHFAVSAGRNRRTRALVGAFEREAIRPHVLGRFEDMLRAVLRHPAMISYLDNNASIGPNSPAGRRTGRGVNENLARELLELHTLGVEAGYTQADVTEMAKALTGWGLDTSPYESVAGFVFRAAAHEPGTRALLGKAYEGPGLLHGEAILADLARNPATARHVARRMAAHFVALPPPETLVARLEAVFLASGGDLAALARTLVTADEAWQAPPRKVLPPYDLVVAAHRALAQPVGEAPLLAALANLGQRAWYVPSPAGWPQEDDHWAAPDALLERLDWAADLAGAAAGTHDVQALGEAMLGPLFSPQTREAVARAEGRAQALAILLMSAEFQKR